MSEPYQRKGKKISFNYLLSRCAPVNGCLEWQGAMFENGYGNQLYDRKRCGTHRLVMMFLLGAEFKEELCVLHYCNNRKCNNPIHLYRGTKTDNNRQCARDGRNRNGKRRKSLRT